jgi:cell division protein FtsZ
MISYTRDPQQTIPTSSVKIVGLGGAGANMLERVALDGMEGAELLAINTDVRTLAACVAGEKIQLGRNLTKGLGAGGDPELGQQAILEAESEIRASLRGHRIVFLCTGLGGGTGSGAAPIVTRIAREEGAFVVVFATMPFAFEGRRRRDQAETALNQLAVLSNALVTFDNNRMGELVVAKQGIHEAFSAADHMICESIKAVIRLVVRPGLINIGLDDLMSALRTNRSRCLFGSGLANGTDRATRALRNALSSPLLDQGALLKDAQTVLVHLCGGEDLTLFEIELLMQGLQKFVPDHAHVLFGAAVDPSMGENLSITLISALPEDSLHTLSYEEEEVVITSSAPVFHYEEPVSTPEPEPEPVAEIFAPEPENHDWIPSAEPEPEPMVEPAEPELVVDERPFAEIPSPQSYEPEPFSFTEPVRDESAKAEEIDFAAPTTSSSFGFDLPMETPSETPEPSKKPLWGKSYGEDFPEEVPEDDFKSVSPFSIQSEPDAPKLKLGVKLTGPQSELIFDSAPRGRFEGESPNVVDGEDLDLPPFLRKKK